MPLPKQQPLNYRLQNPAAYAPDPQSAHYAPDDTLPFDVPIFNETLAAYDSDETLYQVPREMWLETMVASASEGSVSNPAFSFQIQAVITDENGNIENIVIAQQNPSPSTTKFGTAQQPAVLKKMQYFKPGTQLICQVSNLQDASNEIQVVLRMLMRNLPNIPTEAGH